MWQKHNEELSHEHESYGIDIQGILRALQIRAQILFDLRNLFIKQCHPKFYPLPREWSCYGSGG